MKKVIVLVVLSICFLSYANAATQYSVNTKYLSIQGGYGDTLYVGVTPIAAQTQGYIMGMPFNIEDALVAWDYPRNGRQVALMSLNTNCDFNISVAAPALALNSTSESFSLPYYLVFELRVAYYMLNSNTPKFETKTFVVSSEGTKVEDNSSFVSEVSEPRLSSSEDIHESGSSFSFMDPDVDYGSFLGSMEGIIYFKFARSADIEGAPGGDYTANVVITVVKNE